MAPFDSDVDKAWLNRAVFQPGKAKTREQKGIRRGRGQAWAAGP